MTYEPMMTRDQERAFIERARELHAEASTDIRDRIAGSEHLLEGRIIQQATHAPILIFHPEADRRDIAFYTRAYEIVTVLFRARDRLVDYYNRQNPSPSALADRHEEPAKPFDFARDCAIHCNDRLFQKFMFERHGLDHPSDQTRMRTRIHSMLAISSRTELNTDTTARDRWISLRAEFKAWKEMKL